MRRTAAAAHKAYFDSVSKAMGTQCAAMESDDGAGRALGISAAVTHDSLARLQPVIDALRPLGATLLEARDGELGADIAPLQAAGVPRIRAPGRLPALFRLPPHGRRHSRQGRSASTCRAR